MLARPNGGPTAGPSLEAGFEDVLSRARRPPTFRTAQPRRCANFRITVTATRRIASNTVRSTPAAGSSMATSMTRAPVRPDDQRRCRRQRLPLCRRRRHRRGHQNRPALVSASRLTQDERATCCSGSGLATCSTSSSRSTAFRQHNWKTWCVSHPDGLPDLFLDRSLGRIKVPHLLPHAGLIIASSTAVCATMRAVGVAASRPGSTMIPSAYSRRTRVVSAGTASRCSDPLSPTAQTSKSAVPPSLSGCMPIRSGNGVAEQSPS